MTSNQLIAVLEHAGVLADFMEGRRGGITRRWACCRCVVGMVGIRGVPGRRKTWGGAEAEITGQAAPERSIASSKDAGQPGRWSGGPARRCQAGNRGSRGPTAQPSSSQGGLDGNTIGAENRARRGAAQLIVNGKGAGWSPPRSSDHLLDLAPDQMAGHAYHTNGSDGQHRQGEGVITAVDRQTGAACWRRPAHLTVAAAGPP